MLTRRRFVQTVGLGAAGAVTGSWIAARGREDSLWSRSKPRRRPTAAAANPIILSSNENPLGPGQKVLDAIKAAFGPAGAAPGRYSNALGRARRGARQEARRAAGEHHARLRLDADPAHRDARVHGAQPRRSSARFRPTRSAPATRT